MWDFHVSLHVFTPKSRQEKSLQVTSSSLQRIVSKRLPLASPSLRKVSEFPNERDNGGGPLAMLPNTHYIRYIWGLIIQGAPHPKEITTIFPMKPHQVSLLRIFHEAPLKCLGFAPVATYSNLWPRFIEGMKKNTHIFLSEILRARTCP